jgi:hypothetical protein
MIRSAIINSAFRIAAPAARNRIVAERDQLDAEN